MTKGYLGIDIGSISTKGVIIDENRAIIARSYLWTEGNPTEASKNVVRELERQVEGAGVDIVGAGTTGSARRLVGAMLGASVIKNEITAHAVGTTHLRPDVRTILEIGGQDSKIICVSDGIAVDYAMNTLCAAGTGSFLSSQAHAWAWRWRSSATSRSLPPSRPTSPRAAPCSLRVIWCT